MRLTISDLKKGQTGIINDISGENIPLKFIEMGCLPGNSVQLIQLAPFRDPMYININGNNCAIRKELADLIEITIEKSQE